MSTIPMDKLRPRSSEPLPTGALLATAAHILLIIALALGVSWRIKQPDGGEAELWSAVPQAAPAPLPPAPPQPEQAQPKPEPKVEPKPEPQPEREAEIAEKPKPVKQEKPKPKPEPKPKPKAEEPPKKAAKAAPVPPVKAEPQEKALKSNRSQQLNKMFSELGVEGGVGAANSSRPAAGTSDSYIAKVRARVKSYTRYPGDVSTNREAVVRVRCDATGRIVSRRLISSSGLPLWDEALLKGIDAAEVLPLDERGKCPEMDISLKP